MDDVTAVPYIREIIAICLELSKSPRLCKAKDIDD